jgi:hypothetical protein
MAGGHLGKQTTVSAITPDLLQWGRGLIFKNIFKIVNDSLQK